jgi:hypothetical protein
VNDPARILSSADATEVEKRLLAAWDERPSAAARASVLEVLGLGMTAAMFAHATADQRKARF